MTAVLLALSLAVAAPPDLPSSRDAVATRMMVQGGALVGVGLGTTVASYRLARNEDQLPQSLGRPGMAVGWAVVGIGAVKLGVGLVHKVAPSPRLALTPTGNGVRVSGRF
ncbi:MAG: hypothetical protein ACI8PZ_007019 [Myxococcota bacterium]|jgi:hypothetical protein